MFSHAICIDFEATCYDKLEKPPIGWQPEIIEFPAVLIDLQNGKILSGASAAHFTERHLSQLLPIPILGSYFS